VALAGNWEPSYSVDRGQSPDYGLRAKGLSWSNWHSVPFPPPMMNQLQDLNKKGKISDCTNGPFGQQLLGERKINHLGVAQTRCQTAKNGNTFMRHVGF
jgi:hypothetical protein